MSHRSLQQFLLLTFVPLIALFLIFTQTTPALAACPASFPVTVPAGDTARLIEVIGCANATAGNDVINLTNSTYTLTTTVSGFNGLPLITSGSGTLTINGNGATIQRSSSIGATSIRMFTVNSGATLTLNNLTLFNGLASATNGGAISNDGTLTVNSGIFRGNSATNGGGIFQNGGTLRVINSVFVSNSGSVGGGIAVNAGTVTVTNSTFSANSTFALNTGAAIAVVGATSATVNNSILANSPANNDCATNVAVTFQNSLIENGGCGITNGVNGNKTGDPALVNDTTDLTPQNSSIARNAGSNALAVDQVGAALVYDIRGVGFPRITGGTVEMGAYETCTASYPYTVAPGDTPSLINAIYCANSNGVGTNDVINLTAGGIYTLTNFYGGDTGLPPIVTASTVGTLTINGNGATITRSSLGGTPQFRLFTINSGATLTLNGVALTNGNAGGGSGGAINNGGTLNLVASTLSGNTATGGGGLSNSSGGTSVIRDSTLSGNTVVSYGGGIANSGTLYVINSTISGNSANGTGSTGGGGAIDSFGTSPSVTIRNSTITNNTAVGSNINKSGYWQESGNTFVANSIIANNNGANNCSSTGGSPLSFNFSNIDNGTSCLFTGTYAQNVNPMLAPLANNGGLTQTHALMPNSPAINHGTNVGAQDQTGAALTTDQRGAGYPRINGGTADIGSYEVQCPTFPVTVPAGDSNRLIEVIGCANSNGAGTNDVINLTAGSTYVLSLVLADSSGLPAIPSASSNGSLTINGNGATISRSSAGGTPEFRIVLMNSGANLTLNQITLSNGRLSGGTGGAINNLGGTLRLTAVTLSGNVAVGGAGIHNAVSGTTVIRDSTLSSNSAINFGGAISNSGSTLRVVNSTISGNSANGTGSGGGGGAIDSYGIGSSMGFWNSTIAYNTAVAPNVSKSGIWQEEGHSGYFNTIIANNNGANNCALTGGTTGYNLQNIDSGISCAFGIGLYNNTNPLLAPLGNNGGFTRTHALLPGSPAINQGDNNYATEEDDATPLTTDQRGSGFPRISGGTVDIGAFELQCPTFPATIAAGDTTALIFAINCANSTTANDVINLTAGSTYTLTDVYGSETGLPGIPAVAAGGTLTINGNGATITRSSAGGTPDFRFFLINGGANLTLNRVTLSNGRTDRGGAILNDSGTLTITNSTISGNFAAAAGGIANFGAGVVTLTNSLIANNQVLDYGGGMEITGGTVNIINSTISGNTTTADGDLGFDGGAAIDIYNFPTVRIINSTITANVAGQAAERSGIWHEDGTLIVQNSIIAGNNGANNCYVTSGTFTDNGNNLDNGTSCGFGGTVGQNTNPNLAALADNGGFTQTHALIPGSPAINAGANAKAVDQNGAALTTDQRGAGFPRILSGTVDIGAYESVCPSFPATIAALDVNGLINAITCANGTTANEVINLTNSTYMLTTVNANSNGLPPILSESGTLTINGNGATITRSSAGGTPDFRFFLVSDGANLMLNRVTLTNGSTGSGDGGAIYNLGTLTITNSTISGNFASAGQGGGISHNGASSTLTLTNSLIANNQVRDYGGGLEITGGTISIINSTISGNTTTVNGTMGSDGGAAMDIFNNATVTIINSTITANVAGQATARSGIWQEGGTLTIQNSVIAGNNGANNCFVTGGTLVNGGNNIDNGTTCGFSNANGSQSNTDPRLAPLGNNGGFTFTHALLPGSNAINAGSNAKAVDHLGAALTTDQRGAGFPRINNSIVDIGAFETVAGSINLQLTLQGRSQPAPHPSRVVSTQIRILPSGGGAPLYSATITSSQSSVIVIPNVPAGTYRLWVKGSHTLARQSTVTIVSGVNNITTALLLEGDANDNNSVTLPDFSILATAFGKALGEAGYDARADFNGDNVITISDFSLLASNFGTIGE